MKHLSSIKHFDSLKTATIPFTTETNRVHKLHSEENKSGGSAQTN